MPFSASKSASAARALIRNEKYNKEQETLLRQELDAKAKNEKYRLSMMAAALRYLTKKEMEELGIKIEYIKTDPNATPLPPNYMRPTTASKCHSRVKNGGRRTRKIRNGKKKTMRRGGRMRRHHSRNKR